MVELLLKEEVYRIVGAAMEVQKVLGRGFLEGVYQEALQMELALRGIPHIPFKPLQIAYKGQPLMRRYITDLICYEQVIVEVKALDQLTGKEVSQVLNYLKGTGLHVGLLLNFGSCGGLEWKRFVL